MVQPEKRFKVGACTASVFGNEIQTEEGKAVVKSVTLQRAYKDKDGNFQHSTSFKANDVLKAFRRTGVEADKIIAKRDSVRDFEPHGRIDSLGQCPIPPSDRRVSSLRAPFASCVKDSSHSRVRFNQSRTTHTSSCRMKGFTE